MHSTTRKDLGMFAIGFLALFGGFAVAVSMITSDPKCRTSYCMDKPKGSDRYNMVLISVYVYYAYILALIAAVFAIRRIRAADAFFRRRVSIPGFFGMRRVHLPISIGELLYLLSAAGLLFWKFGYFAQWYFRNGIVVKKGSTWWLTFFNLYTHASGSPLDVFIGFILLPVSRHSPIASFLHVPFDGALRVHRAMGYGMFIWLLHHFSSFLLKAGLKSAHNIAVGIFGVGEGFETLHDMMEFFGFMATLCFTIGFIPALPWFRRRHFNMFYIAHGFLLIMICFAILHSTTCVYYAFPGIILWTADLVLRAVARKTASKLVVDRVLKEETGYVRMDMETRQPIAYTPGQYVFLSIPSISALEYHPFSIAGSEVRSPSSAQLSLLIAPMWKSSEWTNKLAARFQDSERGGVSGDPVVIEGPFGHCGFDVLDVDVVTCFVSGSGVAPAFGLARYVADAQARGASGPKKVVIVWAVRQSGAQHSSFIADLQCAFAPGMLEVHIFDTSRSKEASVVHVNKRNPTSTDDDKKDPEVVDHIIISDGPQESEEEQVGRSLISKKQSRQSILTIRSTPEGTHHYTHRMSVPAVFETGITPYLKPGEKLGVFICATEGLRRDIRDEVYDLEKEGLRCFIHEETYEF
ncbi:ferric/cupric-chelate reductase [Geranomyces michiganensis]|nr:ferric/cupric-chelate reductase [Geranomyces michiganensis]